MNKIYRLISEKTNGKYDDLRFSQVAFDNDVAEITITCNRSVDSVKYDEELNKLITELCTFNTPIKIVVVNEDVSVEHLRKVVYEHVSEIPFVAPIADGLRIVDDPLTVKFTMPESMYVMVNEDFKENLGEFLKNTFITPIAVEIERVADSDGTKEDVIEQKQYQISNLESIYGMIDANTALSCASVNSNNDNIVVCGMMAMITDYMSKKSEVKASRPYERFVLYDGNRTLSCLFFPKTGFSLLDHLDLLNKPVCVLGNTQMERGKTGEYVMTVKAIAICSAQGLTPILPIDEPEKYETVKPQPYEELVQVSLFSDKPDLPKSLEGAYVAFDFETTGLSVEYDKPTELGAVKIIDGVITETFSTLINPQRPIPEVVTQKTGITDEMVRGQPLFKDVVVDFYKFAYGATLIGHNIAFDYKFLMRNGNRVGYSFAEHKTCDTMGLAPKAFPDTDKLTLDSVLANLGLENENAHRALSDSLMTAKAFIGMKKLLDK